MGGVRSTQQGRRSKVHPARQRGATTRARRADNHNVQSLLTSAHRIGRRDSAHEHDAQSRAGAIADALAPLARAPRPASGGLALPHDVAGAVGERLDQDVSHVRLHEDATAARATNSRAFAVGGNVVFGRGAYDPASSTGRHLIAHEIVHAAQPADGVLRREPDRPKGVVRMHFDGSDLIVYDGADEKFRFRAESGRPVLLREEDKACGGDPRLDTYMNDKRFVGVKDFGPIPEGTFQIQPRRIQNFSFGEQLDLLFSGHDPVTTSSGTLTGGDWGEGRVAISPVGKLPQGPCGNTNARSGFYLHGGWLAGSSGCIDIGTEFDTLADWLSEYRSPIKLTVKYEQPATTVRGWSGFTGALAYQRFGFDIVPSLGLGLEHQGEADRFLITPGVDAVLQWAGGALHAGMHFEIPLNDKEQFVRLGLGGGLKTRLFHALYARLYGGYAFALTDEETTPHGPYLGSGLEYNFGPVQLGLIYDHLWTSMKVDPEANRVLTTLGFEVW